MDYYGPESQRAMYFKNMGMNPDGSPLGQTQSALTPPPAMESAIAPSPAPPMSQDQYGGGPGRYGMDQAPKAPRQERNQGINPQGSYQQPQMTAQPQQPMRPPMAQPSSNFAQSSSPYSQTPKNGSRPNMGGNQMNKAPRQRNNGINPGAPAPNNRKPTPMGA